MPVPFVLLVLSICAAWLPSLSIGQKFRVQPWAVVYAVAVIAALAQGFLQVSAVAALLVLVGLARWMTRAVHKGLYWLAFALLLLLCLALALHKVPGFNNPIVIDGVQFTPDAKPFTQYLNFDKGSVGLVLLALLSPKLRRGDRVGLLTVETAAGYALTTIVVLGVAVAGGLVRFEPKLPAQALLFLATNLFLTCVAEEAFFRSLIQDPLRGVRAGRAESAGKSSGARAVVAIVVSGALFGIAHAAGGTSMIVLAALAGIGYAAVYARTNRIEAAILVHFGLNATHFLAFTYPALKG